MKSFCFALLVLAGCFGAHRDNAAGPDAGGDDAPPVCGDVTCDDKPANTCVDADTLRSYAAACADGQCSYPSTDVECGSDGCCGDHCCTTVPSNVTDFGGLQPTNLDVAPPNGMFDTDAECVATSALGKCTVVARTGLPEACVCRADRFTIGDLVVKGRRALVLLAKDKVIIQTRLSVSGGPGRDGPGATYRYADATPISGGPGGSFATKGGGTAADAYGEPTLIPLLGGMTGADGGDKGGGGGGALQISAGGRIDVLGVINAGGGGGYSGFSNYSISGGGGGGSGGGVILEAPTVVVSGKVLANGGGGGGGAGTNGIGGTGYDGGAYSDGLTAAPGGFGKDGAGCPLYGYVSGGYGGYGAFDGDAAGSGGSSDYDSRCIGSAAFVGGGGGGGGKGRIRINTQTGCQCGGKLSPQPTFGTVVKQ